MATPTQTPFKVIVFGPTGQVGSATAIAAAKATTAAATAATAAATAATAEEVILAMRDVTKPLPACFRAFQDSFPGFPDFKRVQADLSDPRSVYEAVASFGGSVKRAFVYGVEKTKPSRTDPSGIGGGEDTETEKEEEEEEEEEDYMLSAFQALRQAGVDFVVLLSGYALQGSAEEVVARHDNDDTREEEKDIIGYGHARQELSLRKAFFGSPSNSVAIRAGYFASNTLIWRRAILSGKKEIKLKLKAPFTAKFDFVSTGDVGAVCGTILANNNGLPSQKGNIIMVPDSNAMEIVGPELLTQSQAVEAIADAIGRGGDLVVEEAVEEREVLDMYMQMGIPLGVARHVSDILGRRADGSDGWYREPAFGLSAGNVEAVLGRKGKRFREWALENRDLFL